MLWPTKIASGTTDDARPPTLPVDSHGAIRAGRVDRGLRWLGEDVVRRKANVRDVLERTEVQVQAAGWQSVSAFLGKAVVTRGLTGHSWFATRRDLAMTLDLAMAPAAAQST